eukprot:4243514-Karenia_brevis.AAC.1
MARLGTLLADAESGTNARSQSAPPGVPDGNEGEMTSPCMPLPTSLSRLIRSSMMIRGHNCHHQGQPLSMV